MIVGGLLFIVIFIITKLKKEQSFADVASEGFWLPFKLIPYFILTLIVNIIITVNFRSVDANIGDYWSIHITDNVNILAIDTLDDWHFSPTEGGEAISQELKSISITDDLAFGETASKLYFIFDKTISKYTEYFQVDNFKVKLKDYGVIEYELISPTDYYYNDRRFGDNVMLLLIFIYPLYRLFCLFRKLKSAT